ncbi:hypothetical protein KR093_009285, partial [Drosophila rubida]
EMEPKFVLPSPNFNKNSKEPSKSNLHYLTPCGMTLLPRSKQPPPMYGARGSTVPAKYLKPEQPQVFSVRTDPPTKYEASPHVEFCDNCNMGLGNEQDMRRHLEQHETCPAEDCEFAALANVLERHIEANHITGLYKTVKRVWTPEDIAAWRAERRKRFPTTANVELAKRAKEQRLKRGERLEASKSRFGKPEDRRRTRPENNNKDRAKLNKRRKKIENKITDKKEEQPENKPLPPEQNVVSAEEARKFRGTSQMKDYKHVKAKSKSENALSNMLGMYGTDSEDDEEDATTDEEVTDAPLQADVEPMPWEKVCRTEDKEEDATPDKKVADASLDAPVEPEVFQNEMKSADNSVRQDVQLEVDDTLPQSSDDEAPDEAPIERKTEVEKPPELTVESKSESTTAVLPIDSKLVAVAPQQEQRTSVKRVAANKKVRGLNYKRARLMTKQNTMLSKLLESDIRHERNVLLQCVRYVCEQNFFGIGSS